MKNKPISTTYRINFPWLELELRKKIGLIDPDVILITVEDPDIRVGSGGATINTILVVAEHLSSLAGYTVLNDCIFSFHD